MGGQNDKLKKKKKKKSVIDCFMLLVICTIHVRQNDYGPP